MRWPWTRRPERTFSNPRPIVDLLAEMMASTGTKASRADALSVPAVQRGRNLVCSVATLPLEQVAPDNQIVPSALLRQIDPDVPNVVTLAQTLEDLLFEGIAWWLVTSKDFAGFPVSARHVDATTVTLQPPADRTPAPLPSGIDPREALVWINGDPVAASRVIRFDSPNPAVLKVDGRAIRRAIALDKAAVMYADDPRPLDYFTPADGADPVDDDDVENILAQWKAALKKRSTAYIPAAMSYNSVETPAPRDLQLVELQKQASLDIANAIGVDPEDLGISTTSRTYSNDVDRRRNKVNEVLAPYMSAVTDRLSMGDITRRGYTVRFNVSGYLQPNPTDRWGVYDTALGLGAMTVEEVRMAEGMPSLTPTTGDDTPDANPGLLDASRPADHTFATSNLRFADLPLTTFSVDTEGRVIEGMALPYDRVASQGGINFRFAKGSLQYDSENPGRIKLLRDHDPSQPLGKAIQIRDTDPGMLVRFKVARGPEGDHALELAQDGVLDGLSVGVDFDARRDTTTDPSNKSVLLVQRADWREVSLTAMPSYDDARVTSVAAGLTAKGGQVPAEDITVESGTPAPDPQPDPNPDTPRTFSADEVNAMLTAVRPNLTLVPDTGTERPTERPTPVDPTRTLRLSNVNEAVPYRFDRKGNFAPGQTYDFSTDLHEMALVSDIYGESEAGKRVMGLLRAEFAAPIQTGNVTDLNPTIQRPDLFVDQVDFRYPIYASIDKGAPPNGVQPFAFPKFNSSSGLTADHVQGTEPTGGDYTTTSQTVTPTPISGKAHITREVWDMGGNPAVSTLIFNQMTRSYREGLESAAATFLNTLTAATDITLGVAATDAAFTAAWEAAVAGLNFVRGYDFTIFVVEQNTFLKAAGARDTTGRPFYPQIGPANANGTAQTRFTALNMGGVTALPSWALPATPGSLNNSWLFDPAYVHAWTTAPQRLEFPGATQAGAYAPVAFVDLAIWGYKAFANSDIGAVRQVTYDTIAP